MVKIKNPLDPFKLAPRLMRGGLRLFFFEKHVFVKHPSIVLITYKFTETCIVYGINFKTQILLQFIEMAVRNECQQENKSLQNFPSPPF